MRCWDWSYVQSLTNVPGRFGKRDMELQEFPVDPISYKLLCFQLLRNFCSSD